MNLGSILGTISPAAGIASGQGLGGQLAGLSPIMALLRGHHGGGGGAPATPPAVPDPSAAVPGPAPAPPTPMGGVTPPGAPHGFSPDNHSEGANWGRALHSVFQKLHGQQPGATPPAQPAPTGGMHGVAFGGQPNLQGILSSLQMMAPGQRRF